MVSFCGKISHSPALVGKQPYPYKYHILFRDLALRSLNTPERYAIHRWIENVQRNLAYLGNRIVID